MKKVLSMVLVVCAVLSLCLPAYAAYAQTQTDVVRYTSFSLDGSTKKVYEAVMDPRFVHCTDDLYVGDSPDDARYQATLLRQNVEPFGECYVLYIVSATDVIAKAKIRANTFRDANGNGNALFSFRYVEPVSGIWQTETEPQDDSLPANTVEQGTALRIDFARDGSVDCDGTTLAKDVGQYTIVFNTPGEHTLTLSVDGIYAKSRTYSVKTHAQVVEIKRDALRRELRQITCAFFKSIPLALISIPALPFMFVFPFGIVLPFAPIEIGLQFFDVLSELMRTK